MPELANVAPAKKVIGEADSVPLEQKPALKAETSLDLLPCQNFPS